MLCVLRLGGIVFWFVGVGYDCMEFLKGIIDVGWMYFML